MTGTNIQCPSCGAEIEISEVLGTKIRKDIERQTKQQYEDRIRNAVERARNETAEGLTLELGDLKAQLRERDRKVAEAAERELELRKQARELEQMQKELSDRIREELQAEFREKSRLEVQAEAERLRTELKDQAAVEITSLKEQLRAQREKSQKAQEAELALRREKEALEERAKEMDLEVARKIGEERNRLESSIRETVAAEQDLKLKQKEKQVEDLRKALEDAKRRSELGSQELQGEVLELDIQAELERRFPHDRISPVAKGVRGADIVQSVYNERGEDVGNIVWETKNTKHWQPAWLAKLKQDQLATGGSIAVLVSVALPEEIQGFGRIDGVWVSDRKSWPALASVLREQLAQVAFAHAASEGKQEKMELLYRYLSGDQFRQRVQGIVEAFSALQDQVAREKRAMEKQWREREKQIERVMLNTTGLYGEMRGIVGGSMPAVPELELDDQPLLESDEQEGEV